jgi:hypothetical protein
LPQVLVDRRNSSGFESRRLLIQSPSVTSEAFAMVTYCVGPMVPTSCGASAGVEVTVGVTVAAGAFVTVTPGRTPMWRADRGRRRYRSPSSGTTRWRRREVDRRGDAGRGRGRERVRLVGPGGQRPGRVDDRRAAAGRVAGPNHRTVTVPVGGLAVQTIPSRKPRTDTVVGIEPPRTTWSPARTACSVEVRVVPRYGWTVKVLNGEQLGVRTA